MQGKRGRGAVSAATFFCARRHPWRRRDYHAIAAARAPSGRRRRALRRPSPRTLALARRRRGPRIFPLVVHPQPIGGIVVNLRLEPPRVALDDLQIVLALV